VVSTTLRQFCPQKTPLSTVKRLGGLGVDQYGTESLASHEDVQEDTVKSRPVSVKIKLK
jgi:hypothetical protein